jgi:pyrroloquinoline quinone biosynthesis protein D
MSTEIDIKDDAKPTLAEHVRWRDDKARDRRVLMAPERLYEPDEIACDVLSRLDGETSFGELVDKLATDYDAPPETIARDVRSMLADLVDKGLVAI